LNRSFSDAGNPRPIFASNTNVRRYCASIDNNGRFDLGQPAILLPVVSPSGVRI
jgi:hypothetical protein